MTNSFKQKLLSLLFPQVLETTYSKYNGAIKVVRFAGRTHIEAGGLMQSGKFLEDTWSHALKKFHIPHSTFHIHRILILGLGGGSIVHMLNRCFSNAHITGVDIDEKIVNLGKKYLRLDEAKNLKIKIRDAKAFVMSEKNKKKKYDLVFIDLYKGYAIPQQFQTKSFLKEINQILSKNGIAIFNMLKTQMKNPEAKILLDKLSKIYHDVKRRDVFANTLVFASRQT